MYDILVYVNHESTYAFVEKIIYDVVKVGEHVRKLCQRVGKSE
jgi:hypothetical protein